MNPITVSALSTHIVALFERDDLLRDVWVTGEVSNWKRAASGHVYFSFKDSGASINAVMWRSSVLAHSWLPQAGDQIIAHGYVGVYPERGAYQFYANQIQPAGRGQLYAQFEALKAQLEAEGLFDNARKRPVVAARRRIGVVTSPDAAALRDVLRVLSNRWPLLEVVVFPTLVQGSDAPSQIETALATANRYHLAVEPLDMLLLVRGGGSIEDLWAFNDPRVARAVAASDLPVVAGIGHETDFTIADFVADLRAATPSAAALAVSADRAEAFDQLASASNWIARRATMQLTENRAHLRRVEERVHRAHPRRQLDLRRQTVDERERRLAVIATRRLHRARERLTAADLRLVALDPRRVLQRGYSIVQRGDGEIVTAPAATLPGDLLNVQSAGGSYRVVRGD